MSNSCTICKGTGFVNGKICTCISGKDKGMDLPPGFEELFGNLKKPKSKEEK